nr:hypothetical protein [Tanacetum cinerariifolium]
MIPKFYSNIWYCPVRVFGRAVLGNVDVECGAMFPNCVDNAIQVNSMTPNQSDIASNLAFIQQSLLLAELRKMFLAYSYVGRANYKPSDRAMHLDWDSGKTYLYRCYVSVDGTYRSRGHFLIQEELTYKGN